MFTLTNCLMTALENAAAVAASGAGWLKVWRQTLVLMLAGCVAQWTAYER
jgi:hypothetical protein